MLERVCRRLDGDGECIDLLRKCCHENKTHTDTLARWMEGCCGEGGGTGSLMSELRIVLSEHFIIFFTIPALFDELNCDSLRFLDLKDSYIFLGGLKYFFFTSGHRDQSII